MIPRDSLLKKYSMLKEKKKTHFTLAVMLALKKTKFYLNTFWKYNLMEVCINILRIFFSKLFSFFPF